METSPATGENRFGQWTLTFLVVANMIGAGLFTTSGFSLAELGSAHRVLLAWFVGGLLALCGAYSYGQLSRHMPESGGEYLFLSRAVHPLAGYVAGWISLIAGFTGAIAFAASALEGYLLSPETRPDWLPVDAIAIFAVVLAGLAHSLAPRFGARLQNLSVMLKLCCLAGLFVLGVLAWSRVTPAPIAANSTAGQGGASWSAFVASLVWISLSYSGFNAAVYIAGESQSPTSSVPQALLWGTLGVTVVYLLVNGLFVFACPGDLIRGREDVAAVTADYLAGTTGRRWTQFVVCLALWTSIMSMLMAAPRVYAKMADDGIFPSTLRTHPNRPLATTAAQVALSILFIRISRLENLLGYLGLTLSLSAAATASCLFLPRFQQTAWQKSITAVYVFATVGLGLFFAWSRPQQFAGAAATFAFGAGMYFVTKQAQKKSPL
jgi:APA family basic amino acid/polyamine antiporter